METIDYMTAEAAIKNAKTVSRLDWPAGKVAYHDVDGDGIPDQLDTSHPDFIKNAILIHNTYIKNIRIAIDGKVQESAFITHGDSLATDWYIVE